MAFNQQEYISKFNKNNYKMYQFRIKKSQKDIIEKLDNLKNRNNYLVSLISNEINNNVYTIKQLKKIIIPILNNYQIKEIYLFGSYARGEANSNSDVDIYCEKGTIKTLIDQNILIEELETALNKKVDVIFNTSKMSDYFKEQIMEDLIKLC